MESNTLMGENVEEAFLKCARTILNKIDCSELDPDRTGWSIQYGDGFFHQLLQPQSIQVVSL